MRLLKGLLALTIISAAARGKAATPVYGYRVVAIYPHSTDSYTEGFFYSNGLFYEGTGLKGHSQVLVYEPSTGALKASANLPSQFFGEGIVDWGATLYEWTWQTNVGFVRDRTTLKMLRQFTYGGEGWGMTRNDRELITSDGSSTLTFRNPADFGETRHVVVKDGNREATQLNERKFVRLVELAVWPLNRNAICCVWLVQ